MIRSVRVLVSGFAMVLLLAVGTAWGDKPGGVPRTDPLLPPTPERLPDSPRAHAAAEGPIPRCLAFGPYVGNLDPDNGRHPSAQLIDELMDTIVAKTPFHCIMVYGVLNGLDHAIVAAHARGLSVIM